MHRVDRIARRRWIWTTVCCSSGRRVHCYKAGGLNSQSTPHDASTHVPQVPPGYTILKLKARNARMLRLPRNAVLSLCSLRGAADAAQPFQPEWFFWADRQGASVGGKRPDCIQLARNMQSRRTNTSQNPGSKTIREFRKPVFVINEWMQLVHFSSFKTGP